MRIEEFMKPQQVGRIVENKYEFIYELKNYTEITKDKLELFESIKDYIRFYPVNAEVDYYTGGHKGYVQCATTDGNRVIVKFDLLSVYDDDDSYYSYNATQSISEEEFYKRSNKYRQDGAQHFYSLMFEVADKEFKNRWYGVLYSEDGHMFASETTAKMIKETDINTLGKDLSWSIKRMNKTGGYDDSTKNLVLRKRYEKGKNKRLYQVKEGRLIK